MTEISILDMQNLRHLIGGYSTTHCKMTDYAAQATDSQVKQLFQEAADSALKNKQDLMKFLKGGLEKGRKDNGIRRLGRSKRRIENVRRYDTADRKQRTETVPQTDSKPV